jgi:phosphoribosylformylglycinamidine cyclo-ligase
VVDEGMVIDGKDVKVGDTVIGIASSGFHSNGFSLIRKVFATDAREYADVLMTPTRIYVKLVQSLKTKIKIKAMAHITGGGIMGNVPRVMPENTALKLQKWPWPDIFSEVQRRSGLSAKGMLETFNCGIGYVFIVDPKDAKAVSEAAGELGWASWALGPVVKHQGEAEVLV